MDGDENKTFLSNFDLLDQVKKICSENNLPCFTKAHSKVAEELLYLLGEIISPSSTSQEDKKLIESFKKKYFYVIQKFKPWKGNYESSGKKHFGNQIFWILKEKRQ